MNQIGYLFREREQQLTDSDTVNSNKDINNTVNCIPVKEEYKELEKEADSILENLHGDPKYFADKLARELDDARSLDYFLLLAMNHPQHRLYEALSYTKEADRRGQIRTKKAVYFISILKRWNLQTKFKK